MIGLTWIFKMVFLRFARQSSGNPASFRSRIQHARPLHAMQSSAINSVRDRQRGVSRFRTRQTSCRVVPPVARLPGCPMPSACGYQLEAGASVVGRGFRIFVTVSRLVGSSIGIGPASTWGENCRSSQPTSAMSMSATPTGISRPFRNSSNLPPNALAAVRAEESDERFQLSVPVQRFFTDRLVNQLGASQYTVAAYRDAFRLLLQFASERLGRAPSELLMEDLDVGFLGQFLEHLNSTVATAHGHETTVWPRYTPFSNT